ncbi:MAG: RNA polymerase subunit sigma-24 [Chlorobiaceae bacterium]|nr:RNA polymerase subunit sigma-24 [Chlorobiaceae bacterium]
MIKGEKTPMELKGDINNLAYWMTGSLTSSQELVCVAYLKIGFDTPQIEAYKIFRKCYFDSFFHDKKTCITQHMNNTIEHLAEAMLLQEAEVKFTVLLSEISRLKPIIISRIIGRSLDTTRLWLSLGCKLLAGGSLSLDALYQP